MSGPEGDISQWGLQLSVLTLRPQLQEAEQSSPGGQPPPSRHGWRGGQPGGAGQQRPPAVSGRSPGAHSGARGKLRTGEGEGTSPGVLTDQDLTCTVLTKRRGLCRPPAAAASGVGEAQCGLIPVDYIPGQPGGRESHPGLWCPRGSLCHPRSPSPLPEKLLRAQSPYTQP